MQMSSRDFIEISVRFASVKFDLGERVMNFTADRALIPKFHGLELFGKSSSRDRTYEFASLLSPNDDDDEATHT